MNVDYNPDTKAIGTKVLDEYVSRNLYYLRRIGRSYWVRNETFKDGMSVDPLATEGYDSESGVNTYLAEISRAGERADRRGRIDSTRGTLASNCFFYEYLGDSDLGYVHVEDIAGWFLRESDAAKVINVDDESSVVKVSFPHPAESQWTGTNVASFDLSKDAMVIGLKVEKIFKGEALVEKWHEFTMSDGEEVDDVWIPTKMKCVGWSREEPNAVTVQEGTVSDIRLNTLETGDLEVRFPDDTLVLDAAVGRFFRVVGNDRIPVVDSMTEPPP